MRVQFPTFAVALLAAASLDACVHGAVRSSVAEGGEGVAALDLPVNLPRPRRGIGDPESARLQAKILSHV